MGKMPQASPTTTSPNMNYSKRFVVEPGTSVKSHKFDPGIDPDLTEKDELERP